jgi:GT2 family glycosyltransferase
LSFRIGVLVACHNRVETTLRCLRKLQQLDDASDEFSFHVSLVDDGSVDGTASSVAAEFPSVHISSGDGSLYWAGGMALAYRASLERWHLLDGYLLLNDDVDISVPAALKMVEAWVSRADRETRISVGQCVGSGGEVTYGGFTELSSKRLLSFRLLVCDDDIETRCDSFNGNFVLIPGEVMRRTGGVDARYGHGIADIDLGLRARDMGVANFVWPAPIGMCDRGRSHAERVRELSRWVRLQTLFRKPLGPAPEWRFAWLHRPRPLFPAYVAWSVVRRLRSVGARTRDTGRSSPQERV